MHHAMEDLEWKDWSNGWQIAKLTLPRGESADNPASTKRLIYGPAEVTYRKGPEGGISVLVEDPPKAA